MEKPALNPEERIFTLSDVKQLYIACRRRMVKWALVGAILIFLVIGIRAPKYKVEATFREGVEKGESGVGIKELLGGATGPVQPQAASFMKSFQVLKPLVEKMGLQISSPKSGGLVKKVFNRYRENLKATKGLPLSDLDSFIFQDVVYEGENGFSFTVQFTDPDHFVIRTSDRKMELGQGAVGMPVHLPEAQFTLAKPSKAVKIGLFYPFSIGSWIGAAQRIRGILQIEKDANNKSIYNISTFDRDRHLGVRLINELMRQYQDYLKREHDELAKEQLSYLENKQAQLYSQLDALFDENVDYLTQNVGKNGFIDVEQASQGILVPHSEMKHKMLLIDMELARLDGAENEDKVVALVEEGLFSSGFNHISQKIQELRQQRDLLELSLCQNSEDSLEIRKDELKEIRNQRLAIEKLMQEIDLGQEISSCDLNQGLYLWAHTLQDPEEHEDFSEYLENYARLLSMREKLLQESLFYGSRKPSELDGIDLITTRSLFIEYNNKLDAAKAAMSHYAQFKQEIQRPDFELSSLSSILKDPLSEDLIAEASAVVLKLKDEKYHSSKEGERYGEQIALQKKILSDHLDQLYKVEELNSALIREKISVLQKISLDCINQQMSVLHEQANDSIKERRKALTQERKLLENKMEEVRFSAISLPEKWRLEKWLTIKTETLEKIMQTMTQTVESKTISHNLHRVESRPLDAAILPTVPESPRLYMASFAGAVCFAFGSFFLTLIRQILRGFPTSLDKLKALRLPALGAISSICDGPSVEVPNGPDLELLRRLALFVRGGKVIGLIGGKGPDYSFALVENLARMSTKSIVLRCDFLAKFRKEDGPGLLQIWKGEMGDLPIRKGKGFDILTSGGYTPFGAEMLQSQRFTQLVDILKKNYDVVFVLLRSPLASAESTAALQLCDKAIVTVSGEQTEELTPFVSWAYHEDQCRLAFITQS